MTNSWSPTPRSFFPPHWLKRDECVSDLIEESLLTPAGACSFYRLRQKTDSLLACYKHMRITRINIPVGGLLRYEARDGEFEKPKL